MKFDFQNDKTLIPRLIALVGAILMALSVFFPILSMTDNALDLLDAYEDERDEIMDELDEHEDELKIDGELAKALLEDLDKFKNISISGFVGTFAALPGLEDAVKPIAFIFNALTFLIAGFALIAALCALLKKPIATIIFGLLSWGVFSLANSIFSSATKAVEDVYKVGSAPAVFYIGAVIALIGAIGLIIYKKKAAPAEAPAESQVG